MKRFCLLFLCLMMILTVLPAGAQEPEIYHSDDGDVRIMVENQKFDDAGASGLRNDDSDFTIVDGVLTAYNGSGGYVNIPAEFKTGDGCNEKYIRGKMKTKNGTVSTPRSEYTAETFARVRSSATAARNVKYAP